MVATSGTRDELTKEPEQEKPSQNRELGRKTRKRVKERRNEKKGKREGGTEGGRKKEGRRRWREGEGKKVEEERNLRMNPKMSRHACLDPNNS